MITLSDTVERGPVALATLCAGIAERASVDPRFANALVVVIETASYDAVAYFGGETNPAAREDHVRCAFPWAPR